MKIVERIKSLFNRSWTYQTETIIITKKQCPHCASREMFVFNDTPKIKTKIGDSNEKHK